MSSFLIAKISASYSQLEYNSIPLLYGRVLEVTVKSKNNFVAATNIRLVEDLLEKEKWFVLGNCAIWPQRAALLVRCQQGEQRHQEGINSRISPIEWDKCTCAEELRTRTHSSGTLASLQSYIFWH